MSYWTFKRRVDLASDTRRWLQDHPDYPGPAAPFLLDLLSALEAANLEQAKNVEASIVEPDDKSKSVDLGAVAAKRARMTDLLEALSKLESVRSYLRPTDAMTTAFSALQDECQAAMAEYVETLEISS